VKRNDNKAWGDWRCGRCNVYITSQRYKGPLCSSCYHKQH
jgi:hypothetical protein